MMRTCPKIKVTLSKNWRTLFGTLTMMFVKHAQINVNDEMTQVPLWTNFTKMIQKETYLTTILTMKTPTQLRMTMMFSTTILKTNLFLWSLYLTEGNVWMSRSQDHSSPTAPTTFSLTSYSQRTQTQTLSLTMTQDRPSMSSLCPPLEHDRRKTCSNLC